MKNKEVQELRRIIRGLEKYSSKIEGKKQDAWLEMVNTLKGINEDSIIYTRHEEYDCSYSVYVLLKEEGEDSWVSISIAKRNLGFTCSINKVVKKIDSDYY